MDRPPVTGDATVDGEGRVWPRRLGWAALAVAVGATATFVPPLVLPGGRDHPPAATAPTPTPAAGVGGSTPAPVPTSPATTPSRSAVPSTSSARPSARPGFDPISLHAADEANLRNGARVIECPTCVGGSRVGYIGGPNTLAIRVADVPAAGERTLTVTYETAETRTLLVAVGDGPVQALTLSGAGDWRIPATVSLRVHLPAGTSWVRFFNDAGPAPDVNRIELR
ncbi:hypothetical protein AB0H83_06270 [Dactylosporangium sp. NPDC050688]|uniref:hypothetical protein n=1 Tax=Dactylosporangium sp. NPDC050688 TaxID=3157217 RepID=UPI003401A770